MSAACASTAPATRSAFEEIGYNSRLDAIQAAILRVQLPHLDRWSDARREAAARYERAGLGDLVQLPQAPPGTAPAWHLYVVRTAEPDALGAALERRGIGARGYYRVPTHEQPAMRQFAPGVALPGTQLASETNLAIPISPVLSSEQVAEVVQAVHDHVSSRAVASGRV